MTIKVAEDIFTAMLTMVVKFNKKVALRKKDYISGDDVWKMMSGKEIKKKMKIRIGEKKKVTNVRLSVKEHPNEWFFRVFCPELKRFVFTESVAKRWER